VVIEDMAKSDFVMVHKSGPKFVDVITEIVQDIMLSKVTTAEAARKGKAKINDILRQ
jgi:hypothetical protein